MEKIIKESVFYKIIIIIKNWLSKLVSNSYLIQVFFKENSKNSMESSLLLRGSEWILKWLRILAQKLRFPKLFENSIFAKPMIWTTLTIALAPLLPTMAVLALVIASALSLLLKASIEKDFQFQHYKINGWIFCFMIVVAISSLISISRAESIKIALLLLAFVLFYFVVINTIITKKQLMQVLYIMMGVAILTSIYGIYQYQFSDVYSQEWLDTEMFEDIQMRVYSTFDNPNVFGEYLILMIPIMIAMLWLEKKWKKKLWIVGGIALAGIALILTFSRGCWLGLLISATVLFLMLDKRFIFVIIFALLLSPFFIPETIWARFASIGDLEDSSTSYRVYIWLGTIDMLKDYWLSGVGMGNVSFNTIYPLYSYNRVEAPHSHNLYLQIVVEYGIIGLIVMMGVFHHFFKTLFISMKKKKNILLYGLSMSMMGYLIQSLTDYSWYNYRVFLIFWMIVGLSVTAANINLKEIKND